MTKRMRIELVRERLPKDYVPRKAVGPRETLDILEDLYGLSREAEEHFVVLFLDTKLSLVDHHVYTMGSVDSVVIQPGSVAKRALLCNASAVICAHNHPTGCLKFSEADERHAKHLQKALKLVGIDMLDSLVVAVDGLGSTIYDSMKERGMV